jgi:hypothetical protein
MQCAYSSVQSAKQIAFYPLTNHYIRYEALTAVVMKSIFWDIMSSSPLKANRRFGETSYLHLEG